MQQQSELVEQPVALITKKILKRQGPRLLQPKKSILKKKKQHQAASQAAEVELVVAKQAEKGISKEPKVKVKIDALGSGREVLELEEEKVAGLP